MFFTVVGMPKSSTIDFGEVVFGEDLPLVEKAWLDNTVGKKATSAQFRLKKKWRTMDGIESEAWVSASSFPILDANGDVTVIQGAIFDISSLKWAETVQKVRVEEALEAKRAQEQFIDVS